MFFNELQSKGASWKKTLNVAGINPKELSTEIEKDHMGHYLVIKESGKEFYAVSLPSYVDTETIESSWEYGLLKIKAEPSKRTVKTIPLKFSE